MVAFLCQGTWALAETTGNIAGTITDTNGAPIADVRIEAVAPSQTRTATTDAGGHFTILSLPPDTYTVSLHKSGYQDASFPGVVVFADQTQQVAWRLAKALIVIGRVTSQAGTSLVKSGVGSDLYNVNSAQAAAAQALGGGGNLNNAYSAMASVPGVQTSQGGIGWDFNGAYVRGQNYYYTAFEYDGIPINRAFDNYNSSTESSLGLQELQVYTGGGPSSIASSGISGFVNQVIKTGTFPGFATANFGLGTPQYYHQASVEIGGSTPDRTFSYYVGLSGYNQTFRFFDNSYGAGYMVPGGIFSGDTDGASIGYGFLSSQVYDVNPEGVFSDSQGDKGMCPLLGQKFSFPDQGCWQYYSGTIGNPAQIADRENVVNLHMGIPKANGLRDDIQLLWSGSALANYFLESPNDAGPGYAQAVFSAYGTNYAAPTCGPENIGPGLNVNGCSGGGQILSFLQPSQFYLQQRAGAPPGPYICGSTTKIPGIACGPTYFAYADGVAYNVPFGSVISSSPTNIKTPGAYYAPATPPHAFDGPLPLYDDSLSTIRNDTGITKLQYTYALSQAAYLRAYGYTFYSDWLQVNPLAGSTGYGIPTSGVAGQYQLITHTSGAALDFQDQINDQNLLTLDGNYTTASVIRFNNSNAFGEDSPIGYMSGGPGNYKCYGTKGNAAAAPFGYSVPCLTSSYYDVNLTGKTTGGGSFNCANANNPACTLSPTWTGVASVGPCPTTTTCEFGAPGSPAARAHATWDSLWQGNASGSYNTVKPVFTNAALADQFRPNDKLLINASIRYDNFTYDLPDSLTAADAFYAQMTANYTCVQASTNEVLVQALPPGTPPPANAQYVVGDCDKAAAALHPNGIKTGWVHPNGTTQDGVAAPNFTAQSPSSYNLDYWEPRFSATFTANPDTVFRASAGRYTEPPISASVQYLGLSGDDRSVWNNTMNLGFYSPFHPIPGISSGQYDLSWEQHLRGTDMSFKLTPFYTWVSNWQQQTFIGANFVTQVPVGVNRDEGVEFQFNKGDFTRNGLSGQLAVTYTNSKVMFQNVPLSTGGIVPNELGTLNQAIAQFNQLTKGGGGSPCYQADTKVSCSTPNGKIAKGFDTILNPYYNMPTQGLLDQGGWYNPFSTALAPSLNGSLASYISPWVSSLLLNWRHDKLAITPSISFQTGGYYGSPLDSNGLDPRACQLNSAATGITKLSPKTNPLQCNYLYQIAPGEGTLGYLYTPDFQTGQFYFDNLQQPSSIVGNLQVTYDLSPAVRLSVLGADLFHTCFGGSSAPWTAANAPGQQVCGYFPAGGALNSTLYPGNFYNGTGINDTRANNGAHTPWQQSYLPTGTNNGALGASVPPINVYFNAQVKI